MNNIPPINKALSIVDKLTGIISSQFQKWLTNVETICRNAVISDVNGNVSIDSLNVGDNRTEEWASGISHIELGAGGAVWASKSDFSTDVVVSDNVYFGSGFESFVSTQTRYASMFQQSNGENYWFSSSVSGVRGAECLMFNTMRLTRTGQLILPAMTTTGTGSPVYITATGQLWKNTSSRRYKENERELELNIDSILLVNSVTYNRKESGLIEHSPIAEDVEIINKDFVVYEEDGVTPMALNERAMFFALLEVVKKQEKRITELENMINLNQ